MSEVYLAATLRYMADGVRNSEDIDATRGMRFGGLGRDFVWVMMSLTSSREGRIWSCPDTSIV